MLAGFRKKIRDLEAKTDAFRLQIEKLTEKEMSTEAIIEQLDSKRDAEVSALLTKLGVQFNPDANATQTEHSPEDSNEDPAEEADSDNANDGDASSAAEDDEKSEDSGDGSSD